MAGGNGASLKTDTATIASDVDHFSTNIVIINNSISSTCNNHHNNINNIRNNINNTIGHDNSSKDISNTLTPYDGLVQRVSRNGDLIKVYLNRIVITEVAELQFRNFRQIDLSKASHCFFFPFFFFFLFSLVARQDKTKTSTNKHTTTTLSKGTG
jgi:hypothetical protein